MNAYNAARMIVIDEGLLAQLYTRLLAGEKWKDLAAIAGCTESGLKRCFMRAGYSLEIRAIRKGKIGKTRNIDALFTPINTKAAEFLRRPLRISL